ncbi:MAG TPA: hypothetical protein VN633_20175 [Bryobacteraceae bacterium]|nr:hypothetical protein [Bryobacteraceae bacterium]
MKGIHAAQTWTEKDLSNTLNINAAQAKDAVAVLELQGYIEPAGRSGKWRVTEEGDLVSGAKSPRFTRESMDEALAALRERIKAVNEDRDATYTVTAAVALGISFATNLVYRLRMLAFGFSRKQMHSQQDRQESMRRNYLSLKNCGEKQRCYNYAHLKIGCLLELTEICYKLAHPERHGSFSKALTEWFVLNA